MREKITLIFLLLFVLFSFNMNANNIGSNFIAPPANDDCANAISLTVNTDFLCTATSSGTVAEATASSVANACGASTNANNDVWFKFIAIDTEHRIELLNVTGSQTNMYHSIFDAGVTGDCSTLVSSDTVLCSDPNTSNLTALTIGNTYFVRVFTKDAGSHDTTFDICVGTAPLPPANDDCIDATVVSAFPFSLALDASAATNNGGFVDVTGCGGAMNDGVWYEMVGDGSNVTVTVSPSAWDVKIAIYTGSCGTFTCIAEANNFAVGNTETETFTSTSGVTYYINIGHPSGASDFAEGPFNLQISLSGLSIDDLVSKGFSYYPNPVRGDLKMNANENIKSVNVYNMIGQEVKRIALSNVFSYKLDMSDLSDGVYFIRAEVGDSSGTFKVIKK